MKVNKVKSHFELDSLGACVIIPTYNNALTIASVINDVLQYSQQVIVVNDGSTDDTERIIQSIENITFISYSKNIGKGWALRQAFKVAVENGYQYAITIDADGQHFAKDLPVFAKQISETPNTLVVGARNMNQSSVPGGSSFGNKFSNFWFALETGIKCPDTQSGYRMYPIASFNNVNFFTKKYEFEIEIIVRAAWANIPVISVPVTVYYPPASERVSHFRPYKDFLRISFLNTFLVLIMLLYIKPRNLLRSIFIEKTFIKKLKDQIFKNKYSNLTQAISVGFGVFMGIIPIWGFQLIVAIAIAIYFKLNKALVILAANISIPPMLPFIIYASYKTGAICMGSKATYISFAKNITLQDIKINLLQYILGSTVLAILLGLVCTIVTYFCLQIAIVQKKEI